jgi:hypothetical protein
MQENSVWSFFVMKSRSISGTSKPVYVGGEEGRQLVAEEPRGHPFTVLTVERSLC